MTSALASIALALVACTTSPSDALADLSSRAAPCGDIDDECGHGTDPNTVLACMNAALSNGTLAATAWSDFDSAGFIYTVNVFTDGGHVRTFDTEPDDFDDPDTITEEPTCTGPFSLSTHTVCLNDHILDIAGCPQPQ
jgi:hypothetical protein